MIERFQKNVTLAKFAAYKIGGNAKLFFSPENAEELQSAMEWADQSGTPYFILGSGTNLLISDKGFDGLVVNLGPLKHQKTEVKVIREEKNGEIELTMPSHMAKADLLDWSIRNFCSGLEFSAGIPGTLGGAVFMNAGTKWGSYGDVITKVKFYSREKGVFERTNAELGFKYRGLGEGVLDGKTVVVEVSIKLKKVPSRREIFKKIDEIYSYRGQKQPLELPSCGSVFKNPPNSERGAGRLIEAAALKGTCVGDAEVSMKHANFILNRGHAKAQHVNELIQRIQAKVFEKFQIELETEVIRVGQFS